MNATNFIDVAECTFALIKILSIVNSAGRYVNSMVKDSVASLQPLLSAVGSILPSITYTDSFWFLVGKEGFQYNAENSSLNVGFLVSDI